MAVKAKRRKAGKKRTWSQHLVQLRRDIFEAAFDIDICGFGTINELANEADLCWQTVDRMYRGQTAEPRHSTIFKLAKAVGMDMQLVQEELDK